MSKKELLTGLAYLLFCALLPLSAHWLRQKNEARCALDGVLIEPLYKVRVVDSRGHDYSFCCIHCATHWLTKSNIEPRGVFVTDEASGKEIEAEAAHYVRSTMVTTPTTGNRVHAFAARADAERHAESCRGRILPEAETPFAAWR